MDLINKHRLIATDLAVASIKGELCEKSQNRATVLDERSGMLKEE